MTSTDGFVPVSTGPSKRSWLVLTRASSAMGPARPRRIRGPRELGSHGDDALGSLAHPLRSRSQSPRKDDALARRARRAMALGAR